MPVHKNHGMPRKAKPPTMNLIDRVSVAVTVSGIELVALKKLSLGSDGDWHLKPAA